MRENRTYGSEGGEGTPFPTPIELNIMTVGIRHVKTRASGTVRGRRRTSRMKLSPPLNFVTGRAEYAFLAIRELDHG